MATYETHLCTTTQLTRQSAALQRHFRGTIICQSAPQITLAQLTFTL